MNKPAFEQVQLAKVKELPHGGIKVEYTIAEDDELMEKCDICHSVPHPDFKDALAMLTQYVGEIFYLKPEQTCNLEIRGIALSGSGEKEAVIVNAILKTFNGSKTAINTPRIVLGSQSYGFEPEIAKIVERVKTETYSYLFEGKRAQLSIFGADDAEEAYEQEKALSE